MSDQSVRVTQPIGFIDRHARLIALSILVIGLLIRLPFISTDFGRTNDISVYEQWIEQIQSKGLTSIYAPAYRIDYPPLILFWFAFAGLINSFVPAAETGDKAALIALIKLPSILADVLTTALIMWVVRKRSTRAALIAGACYVFNPAIWYVSAYWGQTDSIYTLWLVAAVIMLVRNRTDWAWAIFVLALMTKLQSIAVLPLFLMVTWLRRQTIGLVHGLSVAAALASVLILPWLLTGRLGERFHVITGQPSAAVRVDVSGYNIWYLARLGRVHNLSALLHPLGLPFSYRAVSVGLYGAFMLLCAVLIRRQGAKSIFLAAAILCLGLFVLFTQIRERYMFPVLAFIILAAMLSEQPTGLGRIYVLLSLTFLFNLITIAPFTPLLGTNLIAAAIDSPQTLMLKILSLGAAAMNTLILVVLLIRLKRAQSAMETAGLPAPGPLIVLPHN